MANMDSMDDIQNLFKETIAEFMERRYVVVKATAGFAVCRLILKLLLFYSCLDFTQNLGKTHFCLTFGVHFSIRSLFFGIFFNVFAIGIYRFDSCFLSTAWIS